MISYLRRHRRPFFVGTIAVFLLGTFVGLGGYFFSGASTAEAVAAVGGKKIPFLQYQARVDQYLDALRERNVEVNDSLVAEVRQGMLRDMIVDEILYLEAKKLGIRVTDGELAMSIRNTPSFQRNGAFDQGLYFQIVRYSLKTSPEEYERQQRQALAVFKLKQMIFQSAKLLPGEVLEEYKRANKGSTKDFEKKKDEFVQVLQQNRALDLINFYLRQASAQMDIRSYLEERLKGA